MTTQTTARVTIRGVYRRDDHTIDDLCGTELNVERRDGGLYDEDGGRLSLDRNGYIQSTRGAWRFDGDAGELTRVGLQD